MPTMTMLGAWAVRKFEIRILNINEKVRAFKKIVCIELLIIDLGVALR